MGSRNEVIIEILRAGPKSRAELVQVSGMRPGSVSDAIIRLKRQHIIVPEEQTVLSTGRIEVKKWKLAEGWQ